MDFGISIPNTDHNEALNDQIIPFKNASKYACRMKLKNLGNNGRIVSEKYVKFIGKHFYTKLELIPFHMRIMRPD